MPDFWLINFYCNFSNSDSGKSFKSSKSFVSSSTTSSSVCTWGSFFLIYSGIPDVSAGPGYESELTSSDTSISYSVVDPSLSLSSSSPVPVWSMLSTVTPTYVSRIVEYSPVFYKVISYTLSWVPVKPVWSMIEFYMLKFRPCDLDPYIKESLVIQTNGSPFANL